MQTDSQCVLQWKNMKFKEWEDENVALLSSSL